MEDRLRIAMVAACPLPAARGTPVRILRLAEALARRGHEVRIVTYHLGDPIPPGAVEIHRIREVAPYRKTSPGPTYGKLLVLDTLLASLLRRVQREHPVDIVHAHHYEGLLVALLAGARRRGPLVYDAHTLLETELPYYGLGLWSGAKRAVGRGFDGRLPRFADHVVAVAPRIRERLVAGGSIGPERVTVVTNGVECERFAVASEGRWERKREAILIFTGNLAAYQRVDLLLEAFARVAGARSDARLLIATHSPFAAYEDRARALGVRERIEVVSGGFDEVPRLLRSADVAVNPRTECDGIPQKLLNYMAAGMPVVSFEGSAVGLENGRNALVVPNGDVAAFADAVLRLLEDGPLAERLGRAAREYAAANSWDVRAAELEAVYREVIDRRRRS